MIRFAAFLAVAVLAAGDADYIGGPLQPANFNQFTLGGQMWWIDNDSGMTYCQGQSAIQQVFGGSIAGINGNMPAQQTASGEYVWTGTGQGGVQVIRRLKIDTASNALRLVDIVANPGRQPAQVDITHMVQGRMSPMPPAMLENGQPMGADLPAKTGAFVVMPPPHWRGAQPVGIVACDPAARIRPQVMANGQGYTLTWKLTVPAGRAMAVVQVVLAQPGIDTQAGLAAALKPIRHRSFIADLPPALRKILANWRGGAAAAGEEGGLLGVPAELLDARGDADLLALGQSTRLRGEARLAAGAAVRVTTAQGTAEVPWTDVLAVAGGRDGAVPRLFLRGGEVLAGATAGLDVRFLPASGGEIVLGAERIGWLVLRGDAAAGDDGGALITTRDGLRLAAIAGSTRLRAATAWGMLDVPLAQIALLRPVAEGRGHSLRLSDGSRLTVLLADDEVTIRTRRFGERPFRLADLESIAVAGPPAAEEAGEPVSPWLSLAGGAMIMGTIDLPELHLRIEGARVPVPPAQARRMQPGDDAAPGQPLPVAVELWSGDAVAGILEEPLLPVRTAVGRLLVPPAEIAEAHVPTPSLTPQARARVADLIAELGHSEWSRREAASKALADLGDGAKPLIEEAQRGATDPEVKRRLERLLEGR